MGSKEKEDGSCLFVAALRPWLNWRRVKVFIISEVSPLGNFFFPPVSAEARRPTMTTNLSGGRKNNINTHLNGEQAISYVQLRLKNAPKRSIPGVVPREWLIFCVSDFYRELCGMCCSCKGSKRSAIQPADRMEREVDYMNVYDCNMLFYCVLIDIMTLGDIRVVLTGGKPVLTTVLQRR